MHLDIRVARRNQTTALFDGPLYNDAAPAEVIGVGIIEKGTIQGQTVIGVICANAQGQSMIAQFSLSQWLAVAGIAKGADQQFKEKPSQEPDVNGWKEKDVAILVEDVPSGYPAPFPQTLASKGERVIVLGPSYLSDPAPDLLVCLERVPVLQFGVSSKLLQRP